VAAGLGKGRVLSTSVNILTSNNTTAVQGTVAAVQTNSAPPSVYGAYVGGGLQFTSSNGQPSQMSGPFNVFFVAIGLGSFNISGEMACAGSVCQFTLSGPPGTSGGVGLVVAGYKSDSAVISNGCKSGTSGGTANTNTN
jgi:hypothetical protein